MFFAKKEGLPSGTPLLLPLLPLRDIVVFPYMVVPLFVGRERSIKALEFAMKSDKMIFLASQKNAQQTSPQEDDIFDIGTVGQIIQMLKLPDNTIKVFVEGTRRAAIRHFVENDQCFQVEVQPIGDEIREREIEVQALVRSLKAVFDNYLTHNKKIPQEFVTSVRSMTDASRLADTIAAQLNLKIEDKQELLELVSVRDRIEKLLELMQSEVEIAEIEKKIRDRVKKQMEKSQKEYYLSEQMRAIQKEMGEKDDFKNEIAELEEQLDEKETPRGGGSQSSQGNSQTQAHVAHVGRSYCGAQLCGLVSCSALVHRFRD